MGEGKNTQSAVSTLEILGVTMEAFVSLLNGLPGHSYSHCTESIFRLFNFISCSEGIFGTVQKEISSGSTLLIVFLWCFTIGLHELSGIIDEEQKIVRLGYSFSLDYSLYGYNVYN